MFSAVASAAFEDEGRGAIVLETMLEPIPGAGDPFTYFPREQIEEQEGEDITRMVAAHDPTQEFVVVLLKRDDHVSTYRVGIVPPESQEAVDSEDAPHCYGEPTAKPELDPPDVETVIAWEAEGGCEAACPHHCWVEPDGVCPHGNPSWMLKLGLI